MNHFLKIGRFVGGAGFLGSVMVYIAITPLASGDNLYQLVMIRLVIKTGTYFITLPSLWLAVISETILCMNKNQNEKSWRIKLTVAWLIVVNSHVLVAPAVFQAYELARQSLETGSLLARYWSAYWQETIAGSVNIVAGLVLVFLSTKKDCIDEHIKNA